MQNNLSSDLSLKGKSATLEPLQAEHKNALLDAAADGELWNLKFTSVPNHENIDHYIASAIEKREKGKELPFAVRRVADEKIIGSTRYYRISPQNKSLSIGYTWLSASAQRTAINTECKYMLLTHAFDVLGCSAVMWHTHHDNIRSQAAIERLGAKRDGILRADMILDDGSIRDTHCFSMLDAEWPAAKGILKEHLNK